jgi:NAD(P)-dependent dehydrogenase (short-subunit alcohol dehydrogenase family)
VSEDAPRPLAQESEGKAPGRGRLKGRRILVVGGGQDSRGESDPPIGNGRAMCLLFFREGATVAIADRNRETALETADLIVNDQTRDGATAYTMVCDVAKPDDIRQTVKEAVTLMGGLDGVVYNVGIGAGMWLEGSTPEIWDRVFAVNLRGAMLTLQAAMPVLSDGSSIVLISSIASMKAGSRMPSYDASKAALAGLMRHAGIEGERRGIRVNIVAPGLMDTSIGREATRGRPGRAKTPVPLGRQGTGWETAYAALFLMSDEAAYITGQILAVDGGMTGLR